MISGSAPAEVMALHPLRELQVAVCLCYRTTQPLLQACCFFDKSQWVLDAHTVDSV